jgi:hypothetical protein
MAYDHCAAATVQGALISGLGLAVFAASSFTPTRQFGYLMIVIQSTALLGDLVLLPALFCGPLGRFFERPGRGRRDDPLPDLAADDAAMRQTVRRTADLAATVAEGRTAARNTHPDSVPAPLKAAATAGRAAAGQSNGERIDNGHAPPVPRRNTEGEPLESPAHSALRDKLRTFRRD